MMIVKNDVAWKRWQGGCFHDIGSLFREQNT